MPKSEPERVRVNDEARVLAGDLEKVMRLATYFNLEVEFPEVEFPEVEFPEVEFPEGSTSALVKVRGRKK